MSRQTATTKGAQVRPWSESDRLAAIAQLRDALMAGRNPDAGWAYYAGKASRIEPTCWALLALGAAGDVSHDTAAAWFARCQQPSGWMIEDPAWPVNIAFNGLAAFTLLQYPDLATEQSRRRLLATLMTSKGLSAPQSDTHRQNNSLQGWSWVDATFSWVEPTCWGLLALKKARQAGLGDAASAARIDEAERLMIDRTIRTGGWNYGNAWVLGSDLKAFVPNTALGLLAMQDRRGEDAVVRSLAALETLWPDEISTISLALSVTSLDVYQEPVDLPIERLIHHTADALAFGDHTGIAQALFALLSPGKPHAFRL